MLSGLSHGVCREQTGYLDLIPYTVGKFLRSPEQAGEVGIRQQKAGELLGW